MSKSVLVIAAVMLVGCGGSTSFTETINNPWTWIAILPFLYIVVPVFLIYVIIIFGYLLVKFLFRKNKDEKIEEYTRF